MPSRRWSVAAFGLALLLAAGPSGAGSKTGRGLPPARLVASRVDEYVKPYVAMRDFSGTVLVARGGRVLLSRGYGFADVERRLEPDDRTLYAVGSITKTMTAAAVDVLVQRGRLALTDPVAKHLPGFAHGDGTTIAHLLGHSSGLKDYYSWPRYAAERLSAITQEEFLAELQAQPRDFPPGTRSAYSNSGYFVLAAIVERASGVSFGDFLASNLFRPCGMRSTGDLRDDHRIPRLARGYDPGFPPSFIQPAAPVSRTWLGGSGSIYSNAVDLYRWLRSVRQRVVDTPDAPAYGWGKRTRFGRELLEQNGRLPIGYASYVALYPGEDLQVVVLSNIQTEAPERIGIDLAAIALGEEYTIPPRRPAVIGPSAESGTIFLPYAGRYEISPGFVLTVRAVPEGAMLAGPDGAFLPLDHLATDRFFFRPLYVPITFQRDEADQVTGLDWNGQFTAKRLGEAHEGTP